MTAEQTRRLIKIAITIGIMAAVVLAAGSILVGEIGEGGTSADSPTRPIAASPFHPIAVSPLLPFASSPSLPPSAKPRTAGEYHSRRAYSGAPPVIPHEVESGELAESGKLCLTCHAKGGYVEKYAAYAPVTPHPQMTQCRQCHAAQQTQLSFSEIDWASARPTRTGRSALPGSPPPMPHTAQMRESCAACHAGPGAVAAFRTPHPDRVNCVQCHVPANAAGEWRRDDGNP